MELSLLSGAIMMSSKDLIALLLSSALLMPTMVGAQGRFEVMFTNSSNVPIVQPAEYSCTFRNLWSATSHPRLYPGDDAHWSPPVLASHNIDYQMWTLGGFAGPGVEEVAETGSTNTLQGELSAPLVEGSVGGFVVGSTMFNFEQQEQTFESLQVDANRSMLSSISMVAPSPDWFTGFYDYDVVDMSTGTWLAGFILETYPFDAGTETGEAYSNLNDAEDPVVPIAEFTSSNPLSTGVFLTSDNSTVLPVARWECSLLTTLLEDDTTAPSPTPAPVTTTTPEPASCRSTFASCDSNSDCCSGLCDARLVTIGLSKRCRSAPKLSRVKLSGETRGGTAGSVGGDRPVIVGGPRQRHLVRGA